MSQVAAEPAIKQSLLQKYDIPIDHLDFSYVKTCNKVKELEKIIKVLRSREEGFYPELLKCTENRLEDLDPSNRLLRAEGKLFSKDNLEPQYWKQIFDDIEKWSDECTQKEKELLSSKNLGSEVVEDTFPPIRRPPKMEKKDEPEKKKSDKISSWDYKKWDKFDADAECLKMDLEEEKRQQDPSCPTILDTRAELEALAKEASKSVVSISKSEKEMLANKEKEIGNEFYKGKQYKEAVRNYTKSVAIFPTSVAYNNRAASLLNMECYDLAVIDANLVLEMEPTNVKALYRRAQANEKLSEFTKALSDLNSILKLEPENKLAKTMKEKLKNKKSSAKPKSSAGSGVKRSKLTLDGDKAGSTSHTSNSGIYGDGRGEPVPGPSGVTTKKPTPQSVTTKRIATASKTNAPSEDAKVKRGLRKVDVLEVDREDNNTLFDWRRYCMEGKSARIEVASKFREKSSKESYSSFTLDNSSKIEIADSNMAVRKQPDSPQSKELSTPAICDASNFTQSWEWLTRERAPMSEKAKLLRSVRPHLLQAVIGNKLEEEMLSDFLFCLRDEFKLKTETQLVIEYLTSFVRLERFNIIKTFLPTQIKRVIQDLMDKTNADNSLRRLYS